MPKSGEFYTFDEVLSQLDIDEQKLKRLVSEGEIRAFREGDEMKFKKSDIDTLDVGVSADGETREVDLSAGAGDASETLTDDLIFDEGDELDLSSDDAGMATAEISSQDTFVEEGGEPLGMSTEPLDFTEEGLEDEAEEMDLTEEAPAAVVGGVRPRPMGRSRVARLEEPTGAANILWNAILVLSILVMIFAGFTVYSAASHQGINNWSAAAVKIFAKEDWKQIEPFLKAPGDDEK